MHFIRHLLITHSADDALAIWSEKQADVNNTFQFNTIQVPILANGIAFYGGTDNSATDNYVADSICDGGGLQVGTRYNSVPVAGTTTMARTTLVRCGAPSRFGPQDCGTLKPYWKLFITLHCRQRLVLARAGQFPGNCLVAGCRFTKQLVFRYFDFRISQFLSPPSITGMISDANPLQP